MALGPKHRNPYELICFLMGRICSTYGMLCLPCEPPGARHDTTLNEGPAVTTAARAGGASARDQLCDTIAGRQKING